MISRRSSITNEVLIACRACAHKLRLRIIKYTFQSLRQLNNESEYTQGVKSVRGPALFYLIWSVRMGTDPSSHTVRSLQGLY